MATGDLIDQPKDVREGEALDTDRLEAFLRDNLSAGRGDIQVKQFPSGFSNLTYRITIGDQDFILRRPPFGKKARTAHDMGREFKILDALHPVFPYCPKPLLFCDDHSIMGCDFYVMECIRGIILRKTLPDELNMTPADVRTLCENAINVLCDLHAIDYDAIGLGDFGKPEGYVKRQVEGWSRRYRDARTDDAPDCEAVMAWLAENMPPERPDACIIHNDFKFDNLVLNPDNPLEIIGVFDWEMATLGDPLMDLGSSLGYWVQADDPEEELMIKMLPTDAPGMMSRREVVDYYKERRGMTVDDFNFYYIFGTFRLAVIAQQIYYRFYHGQTKDERFGLLIAAVQVLERTAQRAMEKSQF
ncbi:MAG: phosphotransferase family protein [Thermodesulfobacteriota bacterium]|nr:phosphotransferase family protein [Thermodesulfobacteriota bacterium]